MQISKGPIVACLMAGIVVMSSCKKENSGGGVTPADSTATNTLENRVKDTALEITKELYLWYNQIPSSFAPRTHADPSAIMTAIRQYSKETGFTDPVDRWSFAMKQTEWDNVSSGIAGDFGLNVFFRAEGDLRVRFVEAASPAGKAGVRRGWRITKLNGSSNITTSNADAIIDAVYYSTGTTFEFAKPDGTTASVTLAPATYQENPIYFDSVYTTGGKKVGYLVFNSFLGDTTQIYNGFQRVFSKFAGENVTDVVVDLRYNGGGYVTVQEKLANYLIQSSANGSVMMKEVYNDKYAQWNETINFTKLGSLNASKIYFIVSENTASASEMLINNMKSYAEVKLVGPSHTYGKPVGFFPYPVGDWYVFPVSSRSVNKDGQGNFFDGIPTDSKSADGLDKDWGDVTESSLASVLSFVGTGNFAPSSTIRNGAVTIESIPQNRLFSERAFKGTVLPAKAIRN